MVNVFLIVRLNKVYKDKYISCKNDAAENVDDKVGYV